MEEGEAGPDDACDLARSEARYRHRGEGPELDPERNVAAVGASVSPSSVSPPLSEPLGPEGRQRSPLAAGRRHPSRTRGGLPRGGRLGARGGVSRRRSSRLLAQGARVDLDAAAERTDDGRGTSSSTSATPATNQEWEVEKIVDSCIESGTLRHYYCVKWKGFGPKDNTWEPKANLAHCRAAIRAYEEAARRHR